MTYQTKAAQKRDLDDVNHRYEKLEKIIRNSLLDSRDDYDEELWEKLYWDLPFNLHGFNDKKLKQFEQYFPDDVEEIRTLREQREAIKATPIVKIEKPENTEEEKVKRIIVDKLEAAGKSYDRAMKISEYFGKMNVTANVHLVFMPTGGYYVRAFYYLNGELTSLNSILAAYQERVRLGLETPPEK